MPISQPVSRSFEYMTAVATGRTSSESSSDSESILVDLRPATGQPFNELGYHLERIASTCEHKKAAGHLDDGREKLQEAADRVEDVRAEAPREHLAIELRCPYDKKKFQLIFRCT